MRAARGGFGATSLLDERFLFRAAAEASSVGALDDEADGEGRREDPSVAARFLPRLYRNSPCKMKCLSKISTRNFSWGDAENGTVPNGSERK